MDNSNTAKIETTISEPFEDRSYYVAHFMDEAVWAPYVRQVCLMNGYDCSTVRPGVAGTYPTFICELELDEIHNHPRHIVVKFFGPLFEGEHAFEVESILGRWIVQQPVPIPSPGILAGGYLEGNWAYLIFEFVEGRNVGEVRDELSREEWASIARQMGEYIHQLHKLAAQSQTGLPDSFQPSPTRYFDYIVRQRETCYTRHQAWNDLPGYLLDQLEQFVLPAQQLVDASVPAHLIHADLTADHLFGRVEHGRWYTHAIIDWGDAKAGTILQELIPIYLDLFRADKHLLDVCLEAYRLPDFYREDFPRKALSMMLLDIYPLPPYIFERYQDVRTLPELSLRLFDFPDDPA